MKRFTIAVCVATIALTLLNPMPVGKADGPIRKLARRIVNGPPARTVTSSTSHWTVDGGEANVQSHLAGWPHHIDTRGMSHQQRMMIHDAEHDRIGPVSHGQIVNQRSRTVTRTNCPTGVCQFDAMWVEPEPQIVYVEREVRPPTNVVYVERQPARGPPEFHGFAEAPRPVADSSLLARIEADSLDPVAGEVAAGDRFHRAIVRAAKRAKRNGVKKSDGTAVTGRDVVRVRIAMMTPAGRAAAKELCLTQMAFSGDVPDNLTDDDGKIVETAIDWDGFATFLERIIPLIIELLIKFGISMLHFLAWLAVAIGGVL